MNPDTQPTPQPAQPAQPTPETPFQPVQPVTPIQPTAMVSPLTQPSPQSTVFAQPAPTAQTVTGMAAPTSANLQKQKKLALILAIASIVIFIGGLLVGYVFAAAAFLGAYAIVIGIRTKATPTIILGAIGLVLNLGLYTLSIFIK
ncbi:MAG TPA: hypothetical protein VIM31_04390 [Candidatus Microsaccharimonas sp.]|jgi:hypothetical protein